MRHSLSLTVAVALLTSTALSAPAHATPLLELTGSFGDLGGQQGRTAANGASAAYFNPALLVDVATGVSAGFLVLGSRLSVGLNARTDPRQNIANDLGDGAHAGGGRWDSYPLG